MIREFVSRLIAKERIPLFESIREGMTGTVLDVGGPTKGFKSTISVNVVSGDVAGDARHLPFSDKSFDYVFSNATLEHIPREDWTKVATEMKRVARKGGVVITPNRNFPIEPHYLVPFAQFFPRCIKRHLPHVWKDCNYNAEIEIPRREELLELFPDSEVFSWGRIIPRHLVVKVRYA